MKTNGKWIAGTVTLRARDGDVSTECYLKGGLAVHRFLGHNGIVRLGAWGLTHAASGYGFGQMGFGTAAKAKAAADRFLALGIDWTQSYEAISGPHMKRAAELLVKIRSEDNS